MLFICGQRWISDTESDLGLGIVTACDLRTVTVEFPACNETRTFAKNNAPLSRVQFAVGDKVKSEELWEMQIEAILDNDGIISYQGKRLDTSAATSVVLNEAELHHAIQFNAPEHRLFAGQIDTNRWFNCRYETLQQHHAIYSRNAYGLSGARIGLIPHQLFIANEVAKRHAPRVLLADEVGLGKTIEACLILSKQLLTGHVKRALIIVPDPLINQWLVELRRRFNLKFSVFNAARCKALYASSPEDNIFNSEQCVLAGLDLFMQHGEFMEQAILADWDLLIVDEAHHLQWSKDEPSLEYCFIEALAKQSQGLLLLTATPEQLGQASHFARLRLLDAQRFHTLEAFIKEEKEYEPISKIADKLVNKTTLESDDINFIKEKLPELDEKNINSETDAVIQKLIDRHGTGHILFRNTRRNMQGFPKRVLEAFALEPPKQYQALAGTIQLTPETQHSNHWAEIDPRVTWLIETLKTNMQKKILVICAHAKTVLQLAETLRTREGIHAAVFHEEMNIIARDRAAAFFADPEQGTQILICSEIGSEGRNFQFAHHLVLFDLPLNPDLLEQRIGRLDRIGQKNDIHIMVPYLENTAQHILFEWYHQGLNAFLQTCPAGQSVFAKINKELITALDNPNKSYSSLIEKTQQLHQSINTTLEQGRDKLLELSSHNTDIANSIIDDIQTLDANNNIADFMETTFDLYGVESEEQSNQTIILHPSDHMQTAHFPELPDDGITITFDRSTALAQEDVEFVTWEHPMTLGVIDLILKSDHGKTAVSLIKTSSLKAGTCMAECLFTIECNAPSSLQIDRFLSNNIQRILVDQDLNDFSQRFSYESLKPHHNDLATEMAIEVVRLQQPIVSKMLKYAQAIAEQRLPDIIEQAQRNMQETLSNEINRLITLQANNPNVRDSEIIYLKEQQQILEDLLNSTQLKLEAIRIIVNGG